MFIEIPLYNILPGDKIKVFLPGDEDFKVREVYSILRTPYKIEIRFADPTIKTRLEVPINDLNKRVFKEY